MSTLRKFLGRIVFVLTIVAMLVSMPTSSRAFPRPHYNSDQLMVDGEKKEENKKEEEGLMVPLVMLLIVFFLVFTAVANSGRRKRREKY